jgi:PAS domain S-box-containing protein
MQMIQHQHYSMLLNAISEPITIWRNGGIVFANGRMAELVGRTPDDLISGGPVELIHPEDMAAVCEGCGRTFSGSSTAWKGLFRLIRKDGAGVWVKGSFSEILWNGEKASLGLFTEVDELKEKEESLLNANQELNKRVRLKAAELQEKNDRLKESNSILSALLRLHEHHKTESEEAVLANFKNLILPHIEHLKRSNLSRDQMKVVCFIELQMARITSPVIRKLSRKLAHMTPMEIQVVGMLNAGKTTKEIADLLCISESGILFHRHNIRKKLGLMSKDMNLVSHLSTLEL